MINKTMNITVGKANMVPGTATFYADSKLTAKSTAFSPAVNIKVGDNGNSVPKTAVIDRIEIRSDPGVRLSDLPYWRVKYPNGAGWLTSAQCFPGINIGYVKDSTRNININGIWQISGKASKSASPLIFTPGIYMMYYYELGD